MQKTSFTKTHIAMDGIRRIHRNAYKETPQLVAPVVPVVSVAPAVSAESVARERRTLLKYLALGGGILVAGKMLGSNMSLFAPEDDRQPLQFKHFRVVETGKDLRFFDKGGNEVLTLDKTA